MANITYGVNANDILFTATISPDILGSYIVSIMAEYKDPQTGAPKYSYKTATALHRSTVTKVAKRLRARMVKAITEQYMTVDLSEA